jgi:hypothetical protein
MSICDDVVACGTRAAGATARAGAEVGGIEKNQVARMPAPEMTAVDFQSMFEKITAILTFRSRQAWAPVQPAIHPRLLQSPFRVLCSWFVFTFAVRFGVRVLCSSSVFAATPED